MKAEDPGPQSLLGITIRRAAASGRFFLVYGTGICILLGVLLTFSSPASFTAGFPVFLPIFGVVGSMGGLVVFTNDRVKGVLEYLLAYGFTPGRLFLNVLVASLVLLSIVVGIGTGGPLALYAARGYPLSLALLEALGAYSLPMAYASVAFAATVGMYWTSLSSPRAGMNSPIGLIPFIGILPSLVTLGAFVALGIQGDSAATTFAELGAGAVGVVTIVVVVLLARIGRLLRREALLSPA
jgi:hypothetical protein